MPYCTNCGKDVSSNMVYCPNCGRKLVIPRAQLVKRDAKPDGESSDTGIPRNTSGLGQSAVVPAEIIGWNWGAFLLWWIWGIGNNTYISFITLIPFLGQIVMPFVLGVKGNEWAWQNKQWESIEHFKMVQSQWALGGLIPIIIAVVVVIIVSMS